jgi:hypothetical protein
MRTFRDVFVGAGPRSASSILALSSMCFPHAPFQDTRERVSDGGYPRQDVIRDVRQALTLEVRQVETDTLDRKRAGVQYAVHVFAVHPNSRGDVRCVNMTYSPNPGRSSQGPVNELCIQWLHLSPASEGS